MCRKIFQGGFSPKPPQRRARTKARAEKGKAPRERGFKRKEKMNNTKSALMITLFSCMSQGKKHYSRVSINKIQELLEKFHKIHVKRRWIFYCMRYLMDENLITKKKRYRNDADGLINQIPSLHSFTQKGMEYLFKKRVTGAWKVLKAIIKHAMNKDKRWPKKVDTGLPRDFERFVPSKEDWNNLTGNVGKKIDG